MRLTEAAHQIVANAAPKLYVEASKEVNASGLAKIAEAKILKEFGVKVKIDPKKILVDPEDGLYTVYKETKADLSGMTKFMFSKEYTAHILVAADVESQEVVVEAEMRYNPFGDGPRQFNEPGWIYVDGKWQG